MNDKLTAVGVERLRELAAMVYDERIDELSGDDVQDVGDAILELLRLRERSEKPAAPADIVESILIAAQALEDAGAEWSAERKPQCDAYVAILRGLVDPENQPNQWGITIAPSPVCAEPGCEHRYIGKDQGAACPRCQPAADAKVCDACKGEKYVNEFRETLGADGQADAEAVCVPCYDCNGTGQQPKPEPGAEGEDAKPGSVERLWELKLWLDRKYNRHGEMEDIEAGNAICELVEARTTIAKAEAENARLRGLLDVARAHLRNMGATTEYIDAAALTGADK